MLAKRSVCSIGQIVKFAFRNQQIRLANTVTLDARPEEEYWDIRENFIANNYDEVPVVLQRGSGVKVYDIENEEYFDLLSGYSAVNMGHCHPKITQVLMEQSHILHHTSRAFLTDKICEYADFMTRTFQYDKILPMNTGCEGTESAIKIARRWGYLQKKIKADCAKVVVCDNNFWGRSIAAISASTTPIVYEQFGPLLPNFVWVPYNDTEALEKVLKGDPNICAFLVEPVQGEAGVIVPDLGYFQCVRKLCDDYNVLLIADEVQTGLGRCGSLLAMDRFGVHADLVVLGKSLSGGVYPISCVLGDNHVMCALTPGTHGSTYGGNPLACAVAKRAIEVLLEEKLCENAEQIGCELRSELECLDEECLLEVRGMGMMNAVEFDPDFVDPWLVVLKMKEFGLLSTLTKERTIRFMPPLTLTQDQMLQIMEILHRAVFEAKNRCWV